MLKINRQTDYAVRVVLALAKRGEGARLSSPDIQQEMLIPKVVHEPNRCPVIARWAGRSRVRRARWRDFRSPALPHRSHSRMWWSCSKGRSCSRQCMQVKGEDDCPFQADCPVRPQWGRVQVAMMREMASINFEELAKEALGVPMKMPSLV